MSFLPAPHSDRVKMVKKATTYSVLILLLLPRVLHFVQSLTLGHQVSWDLSRETGSAAWLPWMSISTVMASPTPTILKDSPITAMLSFLIASVVRKWLLTLTTTALPMQLR